MREFCEQRSNWAGSKVRELRHRIGLAHGNIDIHSLSVKLGINSREGQLIARMGTTALKSYLTGLALLGCIGLYLFHFHLIWKYAVDVPYEDEWASFEPNQLPSGLSLGGLVVQHNEHRLVTTRLLVWLQYRLNGWNLAIHQIVNFVFYGLILLAIVWLARRDAPEDVGLAVLCFFLVYLSYNQKVWK
jgi:hypothetical protein